MKHQVAIDILTEAYRTEYTVEAIRERIAWIRERRTAWKSLPNCDEIIAYYVKGVVNAWRERSRLRATIRMLEAMK